MLFHQLFDPESSTYTYLLASKKGGEGLIIDPVLEHVPTYLNVLKKLGIQLVYALDTHTHADHITATGTLKKNKGCSIVMGEHSKANFLDIKLKEGEKLSLDGLQLTSLFTPGHTDDSYCFLMDKWVFTGDTLLIRATGRTDFQNGDPFAAYDSLFNKVLRLPNETIVYPAHDYKGMTSSTIGEEKLYNPRLQVKSAQEYADQMNALNLPLPKKMTMAISANLKCGIDGIL